MNWIDYADMFSHRNNDEGNREAYNVLKEGISDMFLYNLYFRGLNKGQRMRILFTEDEIRNVDTAIPCELYKTHDTFYYCNDYNKAKAFGVLTNLVDLFKERILKKYENILQKNSVGICNNS